MTASTVLAQGLRAPARLPTYSTAAVTIISTDWGRNRLRGKAMCMAIMATARIRPMLAVTDPTALPMAMSVLPWPAAMAETSISGMVVATDTMVAPMMKVGIFMARAIQLAASTNTSPPLTTRAMPAKNSTYTSMASMISSSQSGMDKRNTGRRAPGWFQAQEVYPLPRPAASRAGKRMCNMVMKG